jgi:hypothetical protein
MQSDQVYQLFQVGKRECRVARHGYRMQDTPFPRRRLGRCSDFKPVKFKHVKMIQHNRFLHRRKFQLLRPNISVPSHRGLGVTVQESAPASPSPLEVSQNYTSHHLHVDQ